MSEVAVEDPKRNAANKTTETAQNSARPVHLLIVNFTELPPCHDFRYFCCALG
jgi:hypothetical protein